jgi:hypothetical protein
VPAFYVDTPLVTRDRVYTRDQCVEAAMRWMDMVSEEGARVILVDAPDRIDPHKLLKADAKDTGGVLTVDDVEKLNEYAKKRNLRVLWSGGIHADQAFRLARLGVFGIFTTGSTARPAAVTGELASDPAMAATARPTSEGVRRIHALVQAGFLCRVLAKADKSLVERIEKNVNLVLKDDLSSKQLETHLAALNAQLERGWKLHWNHAPSPAAPRSARQVKSRPASRPRGKS